MCLLRELWVLGVVVSGIYVVVPGNMIVLAASRAWSKLPAKLGRPALRAVRPVSINITVQMSKE